MYLNGGEYNGIRVLTRKTIEAMMAYQSVDLYPNEGVYQRLGFVVCTDKTAGRGGIGSPGTFNWGGAFNTDYFADPKENIIGIIMKQTYGSSESTTWIFRQMVYSISFDLYPTLKEALNPTWDSKVVIPEGLSEIGQMETTTREHDIYRIVKVVN